VIYLDSSAVLKLLFEEPESDSLVQWLSEHTPTPVVSSELAKVEVVRASRRVDPGTVSTARALVAQLDLVPLSAELLDQAADLDERSLRSLDAVHLASALSLGADLSAFIAYDDRLVTAAAGVGLDPLRPGA
jgi:predicted nucleic acid-binding protein